MTAVREAIGLPVVFLTVLLLGGIRIGDSIVLVEPSVFALVLGLLLLRVLVQSGALAPERLMSPSRSALANLNGFVVLVSLWAAAGQTIALLIPESGLPRLIANVFFLVLLPLLPFVLLIPALPFVLPAAPKPGPGESFNSFVWNSGSVQAR